MNNKSNKNAIKDNKNRKTHISSTKNDFDKKLFSNKIFIGKCIDLSHEGLGVVKDDKSYFINDLLIGEEAKIEITNENKNFGFGKVINRFSTSPNRVLPKCKFFGICGGCDLMHMTYEEELNFKLKMVNETFKRIGHLNFTINEIVKADDDEIERYRNKVQIPFKMLKNKAICGFYKKKTHEIVEVRDCLLQTIETSEISLFIKNVVNELKISAYDEINKKGVLRHILIRKTYNNDYMVCLIVNEFDNKVEESIKLLTDKLVMKFPYVKSVIVNINTNKNNIILGDESKKIYGDDCLIDNLLGLNFKLSHKAFFQINHVQTEKLYSKAIEFANISKDDVILDSYCGVGTICLIASKYAKKAYGIEIIPEAIEDAKENAKLNNIKNVEFLVGATEELIQEIKENIDVLFVDPPRKGLDIKVVDFLNKSKIDKVVYVSCDVSTMARDLMLLSDEYEPIKGCCFDLFPRTANVETVVLLKRK